MEIYQALILGIVQGITELLPISSSAHLNIIPWMFGWINQPGFAEAFNGFRRTASPSAAANVKGTVATQ